MLVQALKMLRDIEPERFFSVLEHLVEITEGIRIASEEGIGFQEALGMVSTGIVILQTLQQPEIYGVLHRLYTSSSQG